MGRSVKPDTHQCTDDNQRGIFEKRVHKAPSDTVFYSETLSANVSFVKSFNAK